MLYQTPPYLDFARPRVNRINSLLKSAQQVSGSMEKSDTSDKRATSPPNTIVSKRMSNPNSNLASYLSRVTYPFSLYHLFLCHLL